MHVTEWRDSKHEVILPNVNTTLNLLTCTKIPSTTLHCLDLTTRTTQTTTPPNMSLATEDRNNLTSTQDNTTQSTTPSPSSSTTPLLITTHSPAMYGTTAALERSSLPRSQTTLSLPSASPTTPAPVFSRPLLPRSQTTTATPLQTAQHLAVKPAVRPSLLKRISSHIDTALELSTETSYTHRNRPQTPSHWTNHAHRSALLKTWDVIHEAAASSKSKYPRTVLGQLVATEKSLLVQFPELAEGEVPLHREWMEYVLGVGLRHPFCAEGKMGRWEVLSGAAKVGGMRGWGAW